MKVVSHNEKLRRPVLEYVLIVVALALFGFGYWAYKEIEQAGNTDTNAATEIQPPPAGTVEEVDWVTEGDIATETALDESYDDKEAEAAHVSDEAADDLGSVYDESSY